MRRLIAIDLPGGHALVEAIDRAWAAGDAVMTIDQRLPEIAKKALLEVASPHRVVDCDGSREFDPSAPTLDEGDALVVATSGTTGSPKLIVHTTEGLVGHARAVHRRLGAGDGDRWLACLPPSHIGGLGVILRAMLDGVGFDIVDRFDPEVVATAPLELGSTLVSLVPTALDRTDTAGFRCVLVGGAADPANRGSNVIRTYGTTETCGGIVYGHAPLDGVELEVRADGQIAVRAPYLARGRLADGEVRPITDADGWYLTGDHGRWEKSGEGRHLVVEGRADDLIITGGVNVWPTAVESVVARLPEVADVAVFGVPDPEWGTRVVAAVVPSPGFAPTLDAIRATVREQLPPAAAPKEVRLVPSLPRTRSGKVRRTGLDEATQPPG